MQFPEQIHPGDDFYLPLARAFRADGSPRKLTWGGYTWERRQDNDRVFFIRTGVSGHIDDAYGGANAFAPRPQGIPPKPVAKPVPASTADHELETAPAENEEGPKPRRARNKSA